MPSVISSSPAAVSRSAATAMIEIVLLAITVMLLIHFRVLIKSAWILRPLDIEFESWEIFILQFPFSLFSMPIAVELNKCKSFLSKARDYSQIHFARAERFERILEFPLCHFFRHIAYEQTHIILFWLDVIFIIEWDTCY